MELDHNFLRVLGDVVVRQNMSFFRDDNARAHVVGAAKGRFALIEFGRVVLSTPSAEEVEQRIPLRASPFDANMNDGGLQLLDRVDDEALAERMSRLRRCG